MTPSLSPRRLWWLLVAVALGCYAGFACFPGLFFYVGVNDYGRWFLDSYAILASNDALGLGRDAFSYNPLDPFGRAHVYSHWWLHLRDVGLTRANNLAVGGAWALAFFLAAIAFLRPRTLREVGWQLLVLCSPPVLLALNRANNDLVIFALLAPVVPCVLASSRGVRWLALPLIAFATGLKFYPAVAGLVLLALAEPRDARALVAACLLVLALVAWNVVPDLPKLNAAQLMAEGIMTFGAANGLVALGLGGAWGQLAMLALVAGVVLWAWRTDFFAGWSVAAADRGAWVAFILGAALLTGCFFTGRNFAYRFIFAVWMAPLLWRLPRDEHAPPRVRRLAAVTAGLLLAALWIDPTASLVLGSLIGHVRGDAIGRWADRLFLGEQPITWAFFLCLLAFLAHFTRGGVQVLLTRDSPRASSPVSTP